MLMYDVSDMFVSLYEFTQYVSGYGTSHIRCTSRLSFVLRVEVYDVLYKVKLKYVNLDYCLTMMIQDVLTCMWSCNDFLYVDCAARTWEKNKNIKGKRRNIMGEIVRKKVRKKGKGIKR